MQRGACNARTEQASYVSERETHPLTRSLARTTPKKIIMTVVMNTYGACYLN